MIRTRFAPSPTGPLHMGGVRTALYCYLFARANDGKFILRIEDTDQQRYVPGAEDYIIESLRWCGLIADEGVGFGDGPYGPYRQSERKDTYAKYAMQLVDAGWAYYAFDTSDDLENERQKAQKQGLPNWQYNAITRQYMKNSVSLPKEEVEKRIEDGESWVIRFKMPRNEEVKFEDRIRGWVTFNSSQLDDKVLLKADGMPTYHLANVVDDYLMKITDVIRGEEWLPSTPLHVLLYRGLGWEENTPKFAHLPLILKPDGKGKLSKRDGDRLGFPVFPLNWEDPESKELSIGYKERGFFPESFINMLAFLGWNPGTPQEIFSLDELVSAFTLDKVGKAGAKFDFTKAQWFNQQYLKGKSNDELAKTIMPILEEKNYMTDLEYVKSVCELTKERATFINEIPDIGYFFFEDIKSYDEKTIRKKWKIERKELFESLFNELTSLSDFSRDEMEKQVKTFMETNGLGMGDVLPIFRIALSGTMKGPPVYEMMELLGQERTNERFNKALEKFDEVSIQHEA